MVWPERFLFPVRRGDRVGRFRLAAGLMLYGAVSLPRPLGWPTMLRSRTIARSIPGIDAGGLVGGGAYLDAATDDARLTLAVMRSAARAGAVTLSRCEALSVEDGARTARVRLRDRLGGDEVEVDASTVVLAGGPGTDALRGRAGLDGRWIAATRGTHVLVDRATLPIDGAVIFPGVDGRILFLIPWPRYTVIGTTDVDADPADDVAPTGDEVRYLLDSAAALVPDAGLGAGDVVAGWAGLRPLLASDGAPSERSREERVSRDGRIFTIAGGKLTGFRAMAEGLAPRVIAAIGRGDRSRRSPTRDHRLCGAATERSARPHWPATPIDDDELLARAFARRYGGDARAVWSFCARQPGGTERLDPETLTGEVDWAILHDDALSPADFLLRRTDAGYARRDDVAQCIDATRRRMRTLRVPTREDLDAEAMRDLSKRSC